MIVNKPSVFIYTIDPDPVLLQEICAGMEEEGVFCEIMQKEDADPDALALYAAEDSMLGCGIAVCGNHAVLQMKGMKPGKNIEAYDFPTKEQSRNLGANAARAIKKQPLR